MTKINFFKRDVILNPFFVLLSVYGCANLYALLLIISNKSMEVDGFKFDLSAADAGLASLGLFLTLVVSWVIYKFALSFKGATKEIGFGSKAGFFLLVLQLSYLIYNTYFDLNVAGVKNSGEGSLKYVFYLLQSDFIFIAISVGLISDRWFAANATLYLVSTLLRGWMGGFLILFVIVCCRFYPIRLSLKKIIILLVGGILLVATLPFIIEIKWAVRDGTDLSLIFSNILKFGYIDYVFHSLNYVANRLQHIGHVTLLVENSLDMNIAYNAGNFSPYWLDGLPQQVMLKISGGELYTLDRYMVSTFFESDNFAANTNPGVAGWLYVLRNDVLLFIGYLAAITIPAYLFIMRNAGSKYLTLLGCFSLVYLWHGWIGAYINMLIYMLFFVFINRVSLKHIKCED